jgi:hypothetical protein
MCCEKSSVGKLAVIILLLMVSLQASTQPGIPEFQQVTNDMHRYYFGFSDLVLAIGDISGLLGGLRVYANWQSGKRHIDAQIMGWFFACLFLSIVGAALKALFGIN